MTKLDAIIQEHKLLKVKKRELIKKLQEYLYSANLGYEFHQKYLFDGEVLSNIPIAKAQSPTVSQRYVEFGWGMITRTHTGTKKEFKQWGLYIKSRQFGGRKMPLLESGNWYQYQLLSRIDIFLAELSTEIESNNNNTNTGITYLEHFFNNRCI